MDHKKRKHGVEIINSTSLKIIKNHNNNNLYHVYDIKIHIDSFKNKFVLQQENFFMFNFGTKLDLHLSAYDIENVEVQNVLNISQLTSAQILNFKTLIEKCIVGNESLYMSNFVQIISPSKQKNFMIVQTCNQLYTNMTVFEKGISIHRKVRSGKSKLTELVKFEEKNDKTKCEIFEEEKKKILRVEIWKLEVKKKTEKDEKSDVVFFLYF